MYMESKGCEGAAAAAWQWYRSILIVVWVCISMFRSINTFHKAVFIVMMIYSSC